MVSHESVNTIKTLNFARVVPPKNQVHVYGYHLNVSSAITMQCMNMIIINVHGQVKLGDTDDTVLTFMPGNFSKHVIHLETSC